MSVPDLFDGRLKLRHLVLVDALSRQRSVMGAAAELHTTQPVATRALQDLETILGVTLFDRGPRGVTATAYGEAFTVHARSVIAQLSQAGLHVVELSTAQRGTVRVGTHLAGSNLLLPRAIVALKAAHPLLTVVVRERSPETLLLDLGTGRADMIVGRLTGRYGAQFAQHPLYEDAIEIAVKSTHPLADAGVVGMDELTSYPWILPGSDTALRLELEEFFRRSGRELPENRVETTSFLTVRQLLRETDALAALPALIVRGDECLTSLAVSMGRIGHDVGIVLRAGEPASPPARVLMNKLFEAAAAMTAASAERPARA